MTILQKQEKLLKIIGSIKRLSVAFSGGIDSAFLLYSSKQSVGKENVLAITVKTPYISERDFNDTLSYSRSLNIKHLIIETVTPDNIRPNPADRCYYCKQFEFRLIAEKAKENDIYYVAAGLNADDPSDYRPGIQAMKELNVMFPLQEAELNKKEIRELARLAGIPLWNKPANACLLSRIPYGDFISEQKIYRIQEAEKILQQEGFVNPRVRTYGTFASIEIEKSEIPRFSDNSLSSRIFNDFIELGYTNVTIDIMGYRSGSMNEKLFQKSSSDNNHGKDIEHH